MNHAETPAIPFETVVKRFVNYAVAKIAEDAAARGVAMDMDEVYRLIRSEVDYYFSEVDCYFSDPESRTGGKQ